MLYFRYSGNLLLLIGQSFILFSDIKIGIAIKLIGGCLIAISIINDHMWDMTVVLCAFMLLDLSKLVVEFIQPPI